MGPSLQSVRHAITTGEADCELLHSCVDTFSKTLTGAPLIEVEAPALVVGPLRGHVTEALMLIDHAAAAGHSIVFLGDLIDGAAFNVETLCAVFAAACDAPQRVFVVCGRHEFGFPCPPQWLPAEAPCSLHAQISALLHHDVALVGELVAKLRSCFGRLPLAATVGALPTRVLCIAGGPSPTLRTRAELSKLRLPLVKDAERAAAWDLLCGDPMDEDGEALAQQHNFAFARSDRDAGCLFNAQSCRDLLRSFECTFLLRGMAFQPTRRQSSNTTGRPWSSEASPYTPGYRQYPKAGAVSLFSAPAFAGTHTNLACFATLSHECVIKLVSFGPVGGRPVPALPNCSTLNALRWSAPLLFDSAASVAANMLGHDTDTDASIQDDSDEVRRFRRLASHCKQTHSFGSLQQATHSALAALGSATTD